MSATPSLHARKGCISQQVMEKRSDGESGARDLLAGSTRDDEMPIRVTVEQLDRMVLNAIAKLPPQFRAALEVVPVRVCQRPSTQQLRSVNLDEEQLLLGLYEGIPLTLRSVQDGPRVPDQISLFREDLEDACDSIEEMEEQVRITLFHELGHYFGFDEEQLENLGYG